MGNNQSNYCGGTWINNWEGKSISEKRFTVAKYYPWVAQLAWDVFSYGQVIVRLSEDCCQNSIAYLGERDIYEKINLIELVDFVSQVLRVSFDCCERIYLSCMCESSNLGLHFWLLPRYRKDVETKKEVEGFFIMHDWVREYNQSHLNYCLAIKKKHPIKALLEGLFHWSNPNTFPKLEVSKKQYHSFIPPPPERLNKNHPWYDYVECCKKDFEKGYNNISEELRKKWPKQTTKK